MTGSGERRDDKAIDYMLTRWSAFTRFLEDGRICLSNNAAERALRGLALGRKSWLFAGSEPGAERAALMYSLIQAEVSAARLALALPSLLIWRERTEDLRPNIFIAMLIGGRRSTRGGRTALQGV